MILIPQGRNKRFRKTSQIGRPEFVKDEHLEYLDELRESGVTNMFGARPYLIQAFPELTQQEASKILSYWMESFSERHPE
jgi:hypothetical protein